MARAVIEIGAETTSLLVAATEDGRLKPVLERRRQLIATRLGSRALTTLVESEAALAREAGAGSVLIAVAPELKGSHLCRGLRRRLNSVGLGPVQTLTAAERGALAFIGITSTAAWTAGEIAVAGGDIGGDAGAVSVVEIGPAATTIAVGKEGGRPQWWASRPLHAGRLRQSALRADPPSTADQTLALELARRQLATLKPPRCDEALLAGPGAGLLELLCGQRIDAETCRRAADRISHQLSEMVAARLDIEPAAARQLPGHLAIAQATSELIGQPLRIAHGGLAEGILVQQATEVGSHEPA